MYLKVLGTHRGCSFSGCCNTVSWIKGCFPQQNLNLQIIKKLGTFLDNVCVCKMHI